MCRRGSCCCEADTHVRTTASSSDKQAAAASLMLETWLSLLPRVPTENALRTGIGYSWQMCGDAYVRPPALDLDYGTPLSQRSLVVRLVVFDLVRGLAAGEPVGDCAEIGESEVFARRWSKANVSLDCRSFTASVDML